MQKIMINIRQQDEISIQSTPRRLHQNQINGNFVALQIQIELKLLLKFPLVDHLKPPFTFLARLHGTTTIKKGVKYWWENFVLFCRRELNAGSIDIDISWNNATIGGCCRCQHRAAVNTWDAREKTSHDRVIAEFLDLTWAGAAGEILPSQMWHWLLHCSVRSVCSPCTLILAGARKFDSVEKEKEGKMQQRRGATWIQTSCM